MTNYTSGNWTVSDNYTDTNSATPKNISVPDLDQATDYSQKSDEPDACVVVNTTAPDIQAREAIKFARSSVNNVYQGIKDVDASNQTPSKKGVQVMVETTTIYTATNSVTGDEYHIPCKGRLVLRIPNQSFVTDDMVEDILKRTIAAAFAEGSTDESRVVELARGQLAPE